MPKSLQRGREQVVVRIQHALNLATKKGAEEIFDIVVACIETTLLDNLSLDGFTIKLNSFGKLSVRHRPGALRKIPFTGETKLMPDKRKIRFLSLGALRKCETVMN
jgi:nucleoid DNA-binding protein